MIQKHWWQNGIVYQIYPRSFCDSNGDGIGDIPGIISKLDYLKSLGVDILWLSPVYPSPNCDNGYDISDYCGIHPDFGTMEDMDRLIAEAKARGIRIIMDLVINHTSDEHPWFKKALAGDPEYRDYYYFRKGKDGKVPNNWGSFFAGDVWEPVGDDEYYLHLFAKKQPDLNWHNPKVYDEVCDVLRFWLDKGIAGFRCDVINIIYKNTLADGKKQLALTGIEHYLSTEGCHDILQRLRKDVLSKYDCFTVGETVMVDTKMAGDLCNRERGELDMVFGFEHMECDQIGVKWFKVPYRPQKLIDRLDKWQREIQWAANYLENHDQPRSVSRFGDEGGMREVSAKMLGGLNLCLRGTAYIYEGQEIGMTNYPFRSLDDIEDVESHTVNETAKKMGMWPSLRWSLIRKTSRDHARTPMQWTGDELGGFTTGKPWLAVNPNCSFINVAAEEGRADGVLSFYREMIHLRKSSNALQWGDYRKLSSPKDVYIFEREAEDEKVTVLCNMSRKEKRIDPVDGEILIGNYGDENGAVLKPYEFRVVKTS